MEVKIRFVKIFLKRMFFLLFIGFFVSGQAIAVELSDVVQFKITSVDTKQKSLSVALVTKNDFKIYKENLSYELSSPGNFPELLNYKATPKAKLMFDPFANKEKYVFEHGTNFDLKSKTTLNIGDTLVVSVQACSLDVCLLPAKISLTIKKNLQDSLEGAGPLSEFSSFTNTNDSEDIVNSGSIRLDNSDKSNTPEITELKAAQSTSFADTVLKFLQTGSLFLFPILFLAGLLTNLTPCVYPMIPITLSVMSQFGKDEKSPLKLALVYMIGMVITYSLLGVGAAMTGQVFGSQLASPVFNVVIAGVMILLGFAMLDFVDLSALQRLSYKIPFSKRSPVLAVGTMGAVSGLVAAPCTGPILSMILVLIAQTREPLTGFLYMFCFALGFGAPYVVLGVLSQKLNKLPKVHRLSAFIKFFFASLMFGLAFYFLKSILGNYKVFSLFYMQPTLSIVMTVIVMLIAFFIMQKPMNSFFTKIGKVGTIVTFSLLCLWLTLWLSNAFVTEQNSDKAALYQKMIESSEIQWETNLKAAQEKAIRTNKKILVDIWADWCAACLEMEHTTWKDSKIVALINDKYVPVKIDYTTPTDKVSEYLSDWRVLGLPAVLIFNPTDLKNPIKMNQGLVKTSKLIQQLDSL